jgi:hypothetical protein
VGLRDFVDEVGTLLHSNPTVIDHPDGDVVTTPISPPPVSPRLRLPWRAAKDRRCTGHFVDTELRPTSITSGDSDRNGARIRG